MVIMNIYNKVTNIASLLTLVVVSAQTNVHFATKFQNFSTWIPDEYSVTWRKYYYFSRVYYWKHLCDVNHADM